MGKERDKLLWSIGKKPMREDDPAILERHLSAEISKGNIPDILKRALEEKDSEDTQDK
ncbi:MAG: hypothetical protein RBR86_09465 [Pseudobdellovibrionaceae bacterium]|jgi:hypothetical protein|nr:hypothetical protein [Pseudobdellovibrionaceae bacterium]